MIVDICGSTSGLARARRCALPPILHLTIDKHYISIMEMDEAELKTGWDENSTLRGFHDAVFDVP